MKKFKADELEVFITCRALKISNIFTVITLLGYCLYQYCVTGDLPIIPFLILCIQGIIFFVLKLYYTKAMVAENDHEK